MAETAKLLNPEKTVLIPDPRAGCSLAASITAADVRLLSQAYPGVPVVTYVNTSAEVKAETDICCTSANAREGRRVARRAARHHDPRRISRQERRRPDQVEIIAWSGRCEVHEHFTAADIRDLREAHPGRRRARPSRMPARSGGGGRFRRLDRRHDRLCRREAPARVVLVTECSMSDNVAVDYPDVEFVRPCNLCPHMKRITLPNIRHALETLKAR